MQMPSPKIRADHLERRACVYIRQSTVFQVTHHRESTERQYHLRERALALGWRTGAIDVIDEDQGQSATSAEHRQGFQRLAAEVAARQVGIVFMLEASRLSRRGSDWHRLIEVCSVTQTLIADEQAVYDPREPNDRLLLGVKGTLSEAELFTLRTRLYEGRWNKARKGQLARSVPTGYQVDSQGAWVKDPNLHIQERLDYVFSLFCQLGVARQVLIRLKGEKLTLPVRTWGGPGKGQVQWKVPSFGALMRLLRNPAYAHLLDRRGCPTCGVFVDEAGDIRRPERTQLYRSNPKLITQKIPQMAHSNRASTRRQAADVDKITVKVPNLSGDRARNG